jgi:hypothetical protein
MFPRTAMDLYKAIQDLYAEKEKLERVIASLEELQRAAGGGIPPSPAGKRRGRKSMGPDERQEVSERMKRYWARRRTPAEGETEESGSNPSTDEASAGVNALKNHSQ